jgi:PKD repeat protein
MHSTIIRRALRALAGAAVAIGVVALLDACGGGSDAAPAPPPPAANHPPVAAFTASATSVVAGGAVAFDASASTDPDGDTLNFSWDFGDGNHGGGMKIAHIYSAPGSYTATLTVADGQGGSQRVTRTIASTASAVSGSAAAVHGTVGDGNGVLAGVSVQQIGGSASGTTGADGSVSLSLPSGTPLVLRLSKSGYADQLVPVNLPAGATSASFKAGLMPREAPVTLDATAGGTLAGKHGASVTLGANALVDGAGAPVTGTVQVNITPLDVRGAGVAQFPGAFSGITPAGAVEPIASHGTVEFGFSASGQKLQLAPGKTATIEIPLYALSNLDGSDVVAGQQIPLWSLDEVSGQWVQEGQGTVVASTGSPSGLSMRATVGHFSWWNSDAFLSPPQPYNPLPKCLYNPGPEFLPVPKPCTIGPLLPGEYQATANTASNGRAHALAVPPGFKYLPTYSVRMDVPVGGGIPVKVPSGVDFTFYACTTEGVVACGTKLVHGAAGASDEVVIELSSLAPTSCASPAPVASTAALNVALPANGITCYSLVLASAKTVTLKVAPLVTGLSGQKVLKDSRGTVLQSQPWFSNSSDTALTQPLLAGSYRIELQSTSATAGAATLTVASVDIPTQAISPPSITSYALAFGAPQALTITPTPGTRYFATTGGFAASLASSLGGSDNGLGAAGFASLLLAPTTSDPLGLLVGNGAAGTQTVKVKFVDAPTLVAGTAQTFSITGASDLYVKQYVFDAAAADTVSMAVRLPTGASGPQSVLHLYDAAGAEISPLNNSDPAGRNGATIVATTLPAAGAYRIDLVAPGQTDVASVTARAVLLPAPQPFSFAGDSASVSGTISALADVNGHQLALTKGDLVRLDVDTGPTSPRLYPVTWLRSPAASGSPYRAPAIGSRNSLGDPLPGYPILPGFISGHYLSDIVHIPADGNYLVQVSGGSTSFGGLPNGLTLEGATGAYTLKVQRPAPVSLALNTTTNFTVPGLGFVHLQIDVASAGDYKLCTLAGGAVLTSVYDPAGNSVAPAVNGRFNTFTLAAGRPDWAVRPAANLAPVDITVAWRLATDPPSAPCN